MVHVAFRTGVDVVRVKPMKENLISFVIFQIPMAKPCIASLGLDCNGFPNLPASLHSSHLGQLTTWSPSDHSVTYVKKAYDVKTASAICHSLCMVLAKPQIVRDIERYTYYGYQAGIRRLFIQTPNTPKDWLDTKYQFPDSKYALLHIDGYYNSKVTNINNYDQWFVCSDLSYYNVSKGSNLNDYKFVDPDDEVLTQVEIATTNFGRLVSKMFYHESPYNGGQSRLIVLADAYNFTEAYKACKTFNGRLFEPKSVNDKDILSELMQKTEINEAWVGLHLGRYSQWKYIGPGEIDGRGEAATSVIMDNLNLDYLNRADYFLHCPKASLSESVLIAGLDQSDMETLQFYDKRRETIAGVICTAPKIVEEEISTAPYTSVTCG